MVSAFNSYNPFMDNFVVTFAPKRSSAASGRSMVPKNYPNSAFATDTTTYDVSKPEALRRATEDPRLEKLTGGTGWSVNQKSFINDIPYARKGTSALLSAICKQTGLRIVVTSALGTGSGPHQKKNESWSHQNACNPKLDIRVVDQNKLNATGLFARINGEGDHLDIMFKPEVYSDLEKGMSVDEVMKKYKGQKGQLTGRF